MTVVERLRMPSLGGATGWLNSEPLGPAELRGRIVLVDFWTLTCINWLRTEPYIRAWSQAYRDDGLIVIGVHTPEFSFEHEIDRVRRGGRDYCNGVSHHGSPESRSGDAGSADAGRLDLLSAPSRSDPANLRTTRPRPAPASGHARLCRQRTLVPALTHGPLDGGPA